MWIIFNYYFLFMYVCNVYVGAIKAQKRDLLKLKFQGSWAALCGYWKLNLGPLLRYTPLTADPSFWLRIMSFSELMQYIW